MSPPALNKPSILLAIWGLRLITPQLGRELGQARRATRPYYALSFDHAAQVPSSLSLDVAGATSSTQSYGLWLQRGAQHQHDAARRSLHPPEKSRRSRS